MSRVWAGDLVRQYFRSKAAQLRAASELAVCEHGGLLGGHREEIHRSFLREILPRRFEVGRGMVYGRMHRSREADLVIWDRDNYPSLPLADHSFFFAESVRVVLEAKSRWSLEGLTDVLEKCCAVRDIIPDGGLSLADELAGIHQEIHSLKLGVGHHGALIVRPHIGTGAIFLSGGASVTADVARSVEVESIDDRWPDVLLLLEPGKLVVKRYHASDQTFGGSAELEFYELGEDALLAFTSALLSLVNERSVLVENSSFLEAYVMEVTDTPPCEVVPFPVSRPIPNRTPIWRTAD